MIQALNALFKKLCAKFPMQMHKIVEHQVSEVVVLDATATDYTGDFNTLTTNMDGTTKLATGETFVIAGHAVEIAKVPVSGGVPVLLGADWMNVVDPTLFDDVTAGAGGLTELAQVRQIFQGAVEYYRNGTLIPTATAASRYLSDGPLGSPMGNLGAFVPTTLRYSINGDSAANQVKLVLPTNAQIDLLGGDGATYAIAVRFRAIGFTTKDICGDTKLLYQVPADCDTSCNCDGTTTQATFAPRIVQNADKDYGVIHW